jgi:hypothetical protein
MTNRQTALAYGVIVACAISLVLLVADYPSERNLLIALAAGLCVGVASWLWLERH